MQSPFEVLPNSHTMNFRQDMSVPIENDLSFNHCLNQDSFLNSPNTFGTAASSNASHQAP